MDTDEDSKAAAPAESSHAPTLDADTTFEEGSGPPLPAPTRLDRGDAVGRYLVVQQIGSGGMGVVYRAYDPDLDRAVAVKLVRVAAGGKAGTHSERSRLLREAQAMARLAHPNVITVYDVGINRGAVFVAMEFVEGQTLKQWCSSPRDWRQVIDKYLQAGRGLAAAHAVAVIHRDFKPDNVMIGRDGRARVLDFGLARATAETVSDSELNGMRSEEVPSLERSMTAAGAVMGTPAYMSPEQHLGEPATELSDQFSFCVALYEALYGARPFAGDTLAALAYSVSLGEVQQGTDDRGVPKRIRDVLLKGLRVDPEARFESMRGLLAALRRDRGRGWRRNAAIIATGGIVSAALAFGSGDEDATPIVCTGAAQRLATAYSEEHKAEIQSAFERTGVSYAQEAWVATAAELDYRTQRWAQIHTDACRATRITGEQSDAMLDRRMACLDRQLREIGALTTVLKAPDETVVNRALDAVHALPAPEACNPGRLLAEESEPGDPEQAAVIEAAREGLAPVRALLRTGQFAVAKDRMPQLVDAALSVGYPVLSAEALALRAEIESETGAAAAAGDSYEEAFAQAIAGGADGLAAAIGRALALHRGYEEAALEQGQRWLRIARALLQRIGDDDEEARAQLDSAEGAMLTKAGRYADGMAAHARARGFWSARAPAGPQLARVLDDIGAIYVQQGEPAAGVAMHRHALAINRATYGAHHPRTAATLRGLGSALSFSARRDEALEVLGEALELERAARGEGTVEVAILLDDIGRELRGTGDLDAAEDSHRRALVIWRGVLGDTHPDVAVSLLNVGYTLNAKKDYAAALVPFEQALAIAEAADSRSPLSVYACTGAADLLQKLGRHTDAIALVDRALAINNTDVDPTLYAETRFIGTLALWDLGGHKNRARAVALAHQAVEIYKTKPDLWSAQIEAISHWLAEHGP